MRHLLHGFAFLLSFALVGSLSGQTTQKDLDDIGARLKALEEKLKGLTFPPADVKLIEILGTKGL